MKTIAEILADHKFFEGLTPQHLELIAGCGENMRFDAGDYLFRESEPSDLFFVLRYGAVAVEVSDPRKGRISIQTVTEGEVLGWSWLFEPYLWHYDARAMTLIRAIAIHGDCLRGKCESDHDFGYEMMKRFAGIMVQRLQATRLQVLDVYG
ncbi:MAG TPA: cyclic nucleotide-binding domain-containing protein [Aggregatilineales bacterium]|nr:cyclic nucleotide-binding domain-containing protein [Aggregatilineales bacterium]